MAAATSSESFAFERPTFGELCVGFVLGVLLIMFSIPGAIKKWAELTGLPVLGGMGDLSQREIIATFGASTSLQSINFTYLWDACLIGLGAYVVALALLAIRHGRIDIFFAGVIFLALGIASLHIITWTIWLLGWALHGIGVAIGFIFNLLYIVLSWIFHLIGAIVGFIAYVIGAFIAFLIHSGLWLYVAIGLGALLLFLVIKYWDDLRDFFIFLGFVGIIAAVAFGLYKLFILVWPYLKPIFAFIGMLLGYVGRFLAFLGGILIQVIAFLGRILVPLFLALLFGWLIYGVGAILMDSFRSAWHAGNGNRGVILCSLTIGVLVAIVLMETNLYHIVALYPSYFGSFVMSHLHESLPFVDVLVFLLVLGISILGAARNLPRMQPELELKRFQTGFFMLSLALAVGIIFVFIAAIYKES